MFVIRRHKQKQVAFCLNCLLRIVILVSVQQNTQSISCVSKRGKTTAIAEMLCCSKACKHCLLCALCSSPPTHPLFKRNMAATVEAVFVL